jgi:hypothetical protein
MIAKEPWSGGQACGYNGKRSTSFEKKSTQRKPSL